MPSPVCFPGAVQSHCHGCGRRCDNFREGKRRCSVIPVSRLFEWGARQIPGFTGTLVFRLPGYFVGRSARSAVFAPRMGRLHRFPELEWLLLRKAPERRVERTVAAGGCYRAHSPRLPAKHPTTHLDASAPEATRPFLIPQGLMITRESSAPGPVRAAVHRLAAALQEEPRLALTAHQAAHLCALDPEACRSVLAAFEHARLLERRADGVFVARARA